jgi:hypothetical protein
MILAWCYVRQSFFSIGHLFSNWPELRIQQLLCTSIYCHYHLWVLNQHCSFADIVCGTSSVRMSLIWSIIWNSEIISLTYSTKICNIVFENNGNIIYYQKSGVDIVMTQKFFMVDAEIMWVMLIWKLVNWFTKTMV